MKNLHLEQFKVEEPQYWALEYSRRGITKIGAMRITRPRVYDPVLASTPKAVEEIDWPTYLIPTTVDPFLAAETAEAEELRRVLSTLVVSAYVSAEDDVTYRIFGDDEDIDRAKYLIGRLVSPDLLDPYEIKYRVEAIRPAANVPYKIAEIFGKYHVFLGDSSVSLVRFTTESDEPIYRSIKVQTVEETDNIPPRVQATIEDWLDSTNVVIVGHRPQAVLRPEVVDFISGGELHNENEVEAALKWFGLFDLHPNKYEPNDLITQTEAAKIANITVQAVNNAIRDGRLRAYSDPDAVAHRAGDRRVSESEVRELWPPRR